eukprot:4421599-Prymnesium_polylepis.1
MANMPYTCAVVAWDDQRNTCACSRVQVYVAKMWYVGAHRDGQIGLEPGRATRMPRTRPTRWEMRSSLVGNAAWSTDCGRVQSGTMAEPEGDDNYL